MWGAPLEKRYAISVLDNVLCKLWLGKIGQTSLHLDVFIAQFLEFKAHINVNRFFFASIILYVINKN